MRSWVDLRKSLAVTVTGRIFGFVSLVVLGVAGYLLIHERQVLEQELQNRGLLMATHLAQQSVDPILREDDYGVERRSANPIQQLPDIKPVQVTAECAQRKTAVAQHQRLQRPPSERGPNLATRSAAPVADNMHVSVDDSRRAGWFYWRHRGSH